MVWIVRSGVESGSSPQGLQRLGQVETDSPDGDSQPDGQQQASPQQYQSNQLRPIRRLLSDGPSHLIHPAFARLGDAVPASASTMNRQATAKSLAGSARRSGRLGPRHRDRLRQAGLLANGSSRFSDCLPTHPVAVAILARESGRTQQRPCAGLAPASLFIALPIAERTCLGHDSQSQRTRQAPALPIRARQRPTVAVD
jgi:hypothetical protein